MSSPCCRCKCRMQRENQFMPTQVLTFATSKVPAGPVVAMEAGANLQFLVTDLSSSANGPPMEEISFSKSGNQVGEPIEAVIPVGHTEVMSLTAESNISIRPVFMAPAGTKALVTGLMEEEGIFYFFSSCSWGEINRLALCVEHVLQQRVAGVGHRVVL